jgi:hypothetical protein
VSRPKLSLGIAMGCGRMPELSVQNGVVGQLP